MKEKVIELRIWPRARHSLIMEKIYRTNTDSLFREQLQNGLSCSFFKTVESDLCKAMIIRITYQQSHYCSRLKLGLCDDTSLPHSFDDCVLLGNHDCSHLTVVIGTAHRYDSNSPTASVAYLASTRSVSGRSWVRIPEEAACDTDVSYADGDIVNIVEGAIITMPLL